MDDKPNQLVTIQQFINDFTAFIENQQFEAAISQIEIFRNNMQLMTLEDCQSILELMPPVFEYYLKNNTVYNIHEFCERQLSLFSFEKLPHTFQAWFYQKTAELFYQYQHDDLALIYCYRRFYLIEPNQTEKRNDCLQLIRKIGLSAQSSLIHELTLNQLKTFREKSLALWQAKTQESIEGLHQLRKGYLQKLFKQLSFLGDVWFYLSLESKSNFLYQDLKDEKAKYLECFEGDLHRARTPTQFQEVIVKWMPIIDQFIRHQQYHYARTYCSKILDCYHKAYLKQDETEAIVLKISEINQLSLDNTQKDSILINDKTEKYRKELKQIRLTAQEQLEKHEDFVSMQSSFNNAVITLLRSILDDVTSLLGPAPCSFAILGLGAVSRHELSAYSDLDFALLIDDKQYQKNEYFQILVKLFKLQMDLLGESLDMGKPGLRLEQKDVLDIQSYGCIDTVDGFLGPYGKYHPNRITIDDIDAYAMYRPMLLFSHQGGEKLFQLYQNFLKTVFQHGATAIELNNQIPRYQRFGLDYLAEHACSMQFVQHHPNILNLKEPFIRFMLLWCTDISLYYNLDELNPDKILALLNEKKIFAEDFIKEFQSAYNFVRQLRFRNQIHHGCQEDEIDRQLLSKEESEQLEIIENTLLPASYKAISLMQKKERKENEQTPIDPAIDLFEQKRLELLETVENQDDGPFKERIALLINTLIMRKTTSAITYRDFYKKLTDHLEKYRPYFIEVIKNVQQTVSMRENASFFTTLRENTNSENVCEKKPIIRESVHTIMSCINIRGLQYQKVLGDGHCLFHAVGLYLGEDAHFLRRIVLDNMENNRDEFRHYRTGTDEKFKQYIDDIREGREWGDHIEIEIIQRLIGRPIIILQPHNNPVIPDNIVDYAADVKPIFLYREDQHYDALLIKEGFRGSKILREIQERLAAGESVYYTANAQLIQFDEYSQHYQSPFIDVLKQQKGHAFLNDEALEHIIDILNQYPYSNGFRPAVEEAERKWQASYQTLLQPFETEERPYVKMPDGKRYHFPLEVEEELFDENGDIKSSYDYVRRPVVRFQYQASDEIYDFHLKQDPELPVNEYANDRLHEIVIGHGTCKTILCSIKHPKKKAIYPALLSQTVPGVMLSDLLKNHPQSVPELDKKAFHQLVLMALLVNPEDGKPNNYRVERFINEAGEAKYRIIGIDNDHAFVPPVIRGNAMAFFRSNLSVKCILYCLNEMKESIDQEARKEFLSLNISKIIDQWRTDVKSIDASYDSLFTEAEQENFIRRSNEERKSYIKAAFHQGAITRVYRKLNWMKQLLEDIPTITLIQLLEHLEPELISQFIKNYKTELIDKNQNKAIYHRFNVIANKEYGKQRETITLSKQIILSQLGYLPTLKKLKREYQVQYAFDELYILQNKVEHLNQVKNDLEAGNTNSYCQLLLDAFREEVINMIDFGRLSVIQQRTIIAEIKKTTFLYLKLRSCQVLTDKDLKIILKNSTKLQNLDVSGCTNLTSDIMKVIAKNNREIKRLNISQLPHWQEVTVVTPMINLEELYLNNNINLEEITIQSSKLRCLKAINSNKLMHKAFIGKYPFLIGLIPSSYNTITVLETTLRKTLIENDIKAETLQLNIESAQALRTMMHDMLMMLFKQWNIVIKALQARLKKETHSSVRETLLVCLMQLGVSLSDSTKNSVIIPLLKNLKDHNDIIRENTAKRLTNLGEIIFAEDKNIVVTWLISVLKDEEDEIIQHSLKSLIRFWEVLSISNREAVTNVLILKGLKQSNHIYASSNGKIVRLWEMLSVSNQHIVVEAVMEGLRDDNTCIRQRANRSIWELGELFSAKDRHTMIRVLIERFKSIDTGMQQDAAEGLVMLWEGLSNESRKIVINTLRNEPNKVDYLFEQDIIEFFERYINVISDENRLDMISVLINYHNYIQNNKLKSLIKYEKDFLDISQREIIDSLICNLENNDCYGRQDSAETLIKYIYLIPASIQQDIIYVLLNGLLNYDYHIRQRAAKNLEKSVSLILVPDPTLIISSVQQAVINALMQSLHDSDYCVRQYAAISLGKCANIIPISSQKTVIDALIDSLKDHDSEVQQNTADALVRLGKVILNENRQAIIDGLMQERKNVDYYVRQYATDALVELGEILFESDQGINIDLLTSALYDSNYAVRQLATKSLGKYILQLSGNDQSAIFDILSQKLVHDNYYAVRQQTADSLAKFGEVDCLNINPKVITNTLMQGLKDNDTEVRQHVASALIKFGLSFSDPSLQKIVIDALVRGLIDDYAYVRQQAAECLIKLGNIISETNRQTIIELFIKQFEDDDYRVRQHAASSLVKLGELFPEVNRPIIIDTLKHKLEDSNFNVRQLVAECLGKLCNVSVIFPVLFKKNHAVMFSSINANIIRSFIHNRKLTNSTKKKNKNQIFEKNEYNETSSTVSSIDSELSQPCDDMLIEVKEQINALKEENKRLQSQLKM